MGPEDSDMKRGDADPQNITTSEFASRNCRLEIRDIVGQFACSDMTLKDADILVADIYDKIAHTW